MAALSGSEPREEDTRAFEQLSALLYESEEASEYLLAQMKVQQLVAQLLEKITREAGLDIPLGSARRKPIETQKESANP